MRAFAADVAYSTASRVQKARHLFRCTQKNGGLTLDWQYKNALERITARLICVAALPSLLYDVSPRAETGACTRDERLKRF